MLPWGLGRLRVIRSLRDCVFWSLLREFEDVRVTGSARIFRSRHLL